MAQSNISVVIICRNAASTIQKVIAGALQVSDDVIVADNGSTDATIELVAHTQAKLLVTDWQGYGATKNLADTYARHDWILSIDADEYIDEKLAKQLLAASLNDITAVYTFKRVNYLGSHAIRFGEWGKGTGLVTRLFNRNNASWDTSPVHENLLFQQSGPTIRLEGTLHHYTSPAIGVYQEKLDKYAVLMAEKYRLKGKKASVFKQLFSPAFNFIQNYLFKGGFLDGKDGWDIAKAHAAYTWRKYALLKKRTE